jgi:hypothetical protein
MIALASALVGQLNRLPSDQPVVLPDEQLTTAGALVAWLSKLSDTPIDLSGFWDDDDDDDDDDEPDEYSGYADYVIMDGDFDCIELSLVSAPDLPACGVVRLVQA